MRTIVQIGYDRYLLHGMLEDFVKIMGMLEPAKYESVNGVYKYVLSGKHLLFSINMVDRNEVVDLEPEDVIKLKINKLEAESEQRYSWYEKEKEKADKLSAQVDQLLQYVTELKSKGGDLPTL